MSFYVRFSSKTKASDMLSEMDNKMLNQRHQVVTKNASDVLMTQMILSQLKKDQWLSLSSIMKMYPKHSILGNEKALYDMCQTACRLKCAKMVYMKQKHMANDTKHMANDTKHKCKLLDKTFTATHLDDFKTYIQTRELLSMCMLRHIGIGKKINLCGFDQTGQIKGDKFTLTFVLESFPNQHSSDPNEAGHIVGTIESSAVDDGALLFQGEDQPIRFVFSPDMSDVYIEHSEMKRLGLLF